MIRVRGAAVLWLVFAVLLTLRNRNLLLHAEFWGEDGCAWFPDAYAFGFRSLGHPVAGYLQTVSRIVGLAAQAFPLRWAPTLFAAAALAIQALPPAYLASRRMQRAWPSFGQRLGFALLWVALPNMQEVHANLTNAQWHLAALAFLVLFADQPRRRRDWVFDVSSLSISGLSGPFCMLLLPIAAWRAWADRERATAVRLAVVGLCSLVQGLTLLQTVGDRTKAPLGADPLTLARIVAQQVVLAPWLGETHLGRLLAVPGWQAGWWPVVVSLGALALALAAFWRGPALLQGACLLGGLGLAAALMRPQISLSGEQWRYMLLPGVGQRYYYLPMLAWLGVLFWLAGRRRGLAGAAGKVVLAAVLFGVWSDWSMPDRTPTGFAARAKMFERSAPGTAVAFPINPAMDQAPMVLIRR